MSLILSVALCFASGVSGTLKTESQILTDAVYWRNYRVWNTLYATQGAPSMYTTCGYSVGASVCGCNDSGGTLVQCGESGTTVPTIANGGTLPNQNPTATSDSRCVAAGFGAVEAFSCSTGPEHTLDWWKEPKDGVSQCYPPSKLYEAFEQGTMPVVSSDSVFGADGAVAAAWIEDFPYFSKEGVFKAVVYDGTIKVQLDRQSDWEETGTACSNYLMQPTSNGDLVVTGSAASEIVIFGATNTAPAGKSLSLQSGAVVLLEAVSTGVGPIAFTTSQKVVVSGVTCGSACTVSFTNSQDILIADTMTEGSVSLIGVTASIYNTSVTSSAGSVTVNGGTYLWVGGTNAGTFSVTGNPAATLTIDSNTGSFTADSGTFTMKVGLNTGTITASEGVTGTLTVLENTGIISVPPGVTLVTYTFAKTKLVQIITATGLEVSDLEDTARLKALECAIQKAIGAFDCMNVDVTGVATARRTAAITYEVTYEEGEKDSILAKMNSIATDPSGTVGAAILASLVSITGKTSITITASSATTENRDGSSTSSSTNVAMIVGVTVACVVVCIAAAVGAFCYFKRQQQPVAPEECVAIEDAGSVVTPDDKDLGPEDPKPVDLNTKVEDLS